MKPGCNSTSGTTESQADFRPQFAGNNKYTSYLILIREWEMEKNKEEKQYRWQMKEQSTGVKLALLGQNSMKAANVNQDEPEVISLNFT